MVNVTHYIQREHIIRQKIRRDNDIIYGARSMNVQIAFPYRRNTNDFDVYSVTPRRRAKQMERLLDKDIGQDQYYTKPAMHPGTFKVIDKGLDRRKGTADDYGIVDYTKPNRKIRTVRPIGIDTKYAHVSERVKDAKRALKQPEFKFRWDKDNMDLWRIKMGRLLR